MAAAIVRSAGRENRVSQQKTTKADMSERIATEIIAATRDDRILWRNAAGPGEAPRFEASLPSANLQLAHTHRGWRLIAAKTRRGFDAVPVPGGADLIMTASHEQSQRLRPLAEQSLARRNRRIMNVARATGHRIDNPGPLDDAMHHLGNSLLAMRQQNAFRLWERLWASGDHGRGAGYDMHIAGHTVRVATDHEGTAKITLYQDRKTIGTLGPGGHGPLADLAQALADLHEDAPPPDPATLAEHMIDAEIQRGP